MAVNIVVVPIQPEPSQTAIVLLANQLCTINVYVKSALGVLSMYFDLLVSGEPVVTSVLCRDRICLVREGYLGFVGDFFFKDTQGVDDPEYTGLGTRWVLCYLQLPEANS